MRHRAALERRTSVWEDAGIGVAVFAVTAAIVFIIGVWTQYVAGMLFVLATAVLAWHSGFRPALITTVLSTIAIAPMTQALDASAAGVNLNIRAFAIALVSGVVSWLCGNLYRARESLLIEQSRLRESENFHRLIGELASDFAFHARVDLAGQITIDSATSGLQAILGYALTDLQGRPGLSLIRSRSR